MRKFENIMQAEAVIEESALKDGISYEEREKQIMDGVDILWEVPELTELRRKYFPEGKPSAAELLARLSQTLYNAHLELVVPVLYWYLTIKHGWFPGRSSPACKEQNIKK